MNPEFLFPGAGDGSVEVVDDFGGELHSRHGADGVRGVVGEAEFVRVGEGAELEEGVVGEEVLGGDGGVVDFGYVDVVEDFWVSKECVSENGDLGKFGRKNTHGCKRS